MNRAVWKFQLDTGHNTKTVLQLPLNSKVLHLAFQSRDLMIWVEVDKDEKEKELREFYTMHTGGLFTDDSLKFVQTIVYSDTYVLHAYEKIKEKFLTDDDMRL